MDANNYVGASGDGWDVVVNGVKIGHYTSQAAAESAFNTARGGGTGGGAGTNTPTTPGVSPSAGAAPIAGAVGGFVDPAAIKALMDLASQNAQQAYLNARLELEKQTAGQAWTAKQEELAQAAAHDAWSKTIAGREADVQEAATSGYIGGVNQVADRVSAAWNRLPPEQRTGANAAAIWKTQVPGLTDAEAVAMNDAAHQFAAVNGTAMPADIVGQTLAAITNGRITGQTATLGREQEQNKTGLALLDWVSRNRGPDNAFAYAAGLANVPPAMRAQLDAMMQRAGIAYQVPGLGTVAGQLSQGGFGGMTQQGYGGVQQAAPAGMVQSTPTVGAAGMTQQIQPAMVAAPGVGGTATPTATGGQTQSSTPYMTYTGPGSPSAGGVTGQPATPPTGLTQTSGNAMTYTGPAAGAPAVQHLYQMSPQQLNNTPDYVKRLMLAGLEAGGEDKQNELDQYQLSLPKYSGPTRATVRV